MPHPPQFRILPKETALFEEAVPKQRTFIPPNGDACGRFPHPIPLAEPQDAPLPIDKFLPNEEDESCRN